MKEVRGENGKIIWSENLIGCVLDWENEAIDEIRENGIMVGEIGKTHFYNPNNNYRLEEIKPVRRNV